MAEKRQNEVKKKKKKTPERDGEKRTAGTGVSAAGMQW